MDKLQNKATEDIDVTSQIKMLRSVQLFTSKSTALPALDVLTNREPGLLLICEELKYLRFLLILMRIKESKSSLTDHEEDWGKA